jgi:hypothetical protein
VLPVCVLALFRRVKGAPAIGCQLAHMLDRATSICERAPDSCTPCYGPPIQRHTQLHIIPQRKNSAMASEIDSLNFHIPPHCIWFCCSIILTRIKWCSFMLWYMYILDDLCLELLFLVLLVIKSVLRFQSYPCVFCLTINWISFPENPKDTKGSVPISYRGVLLNTLLHAIVLSFFLHNFWMY